MAEINTPDEIGWPQKTDGLLLAIQLPPLVFHRGWFPKSPFPPFPTSL